MKKIIVDWDESTGQISVQNEKKGFLPFYLGAVFADTGWKIEEAGGDLREVNAKLDELLRRTQL